MQFLKADSVLETQCRGGGGFAGHQTQCLLMQCLEAVDLSCCGGRQSKVCWVLSCSFPTSPEAMHTLLAARVILLPVNYSAGFCPLSECLLGLCRCLDVYISMATIACCLYGVFCFQISLYGHHQ